MVLYNILVTSSALWFNLCSSYFPRMPLELQHEYRSPRGDGFWWECKFLFHWIRRNLRFCISDKFLGDAGPVGPQITLPRRKALEDHVLFWICLSLTERLVHKLGSSFLGPGKRCLISLSIYKNGMIIFTTPLLNELLRSFEMHVNAFYS